MIGILFAILRYNQQTIEIILIKDTPMSHSVVQLTQDLVAIPSVSRWSNAEVSDYIEKWLRANGFDEIERLEYTDKNGEIKVNLVAKKGEGTGGLALLSHSDTVPGMEDQWGAFDPVIKDGQLYGRGSCDMKGPLAATMIAAANIDPAKLKKPIYVVVTSDEEIGLHGAKYVAENSTLLKASKPDYGIVAEPTSMIPVYAHKGGGRVYVTAHGIAAHTSTGKGESASIKLAPFLAEMAELNTRFLTDESYMNHDFDPPTNGFNLNFQDDGIGNITSATAKCTVSIRAMPDARYEEIIEEIVAKAESYGFEARGGVGHPVFTDIDSPLVQAACEATGISTPQTVPYGTDGFHFQSLMKIVVLGPGNIDVAHTTRESVPVSELESAVDVYKQMIDKLC
jgi:acetylornithine deacetylase